MPWIHNESTNNSWLGHLPGIAEAGSHWRFDLQFPIYVVSPDSHSMSPLDPENTLYWQCYYFIILSIEIHFKGSLFKVSVSSNVYLKQIHFLMQHEYLKTNSLFLSFFRLNLSSINLHIQAEEMLSLISSLTSLKELFIFGAST